MSQKAVVYFMRTKPGESLSKAGRRLLAQVLGFSPTLERGPHGKPFLADRDKPCFNLSHTRGAVVCAVSDAPCGVDIERADREIRPALAKRCFTRRELEWAAEGPERERLTALWTRKEALLKRDGRGLTVPLQSVETGDCPALFTTTIAEFTVSLCCAADEFRLIERTYIESEGHGMLDELTMDCVLEKTEWDEIAEELKTKLGVLQQKARELKIPTVIVFEGWGASGKGSMISRLIGNLDPRGFSVHSILPPTDDERRYPWMRRYWKKLPLYGEMAIFDRSWYQQIAVYEGESLGKKQREQRTEEIRDFERQITDDGYLLLKFFLHITKKEQKKRFRALEEKKETRWRVTKADWAHQERYDHYKERFDELMERTNDPQTAWTLVDATDKRYATCKVFTTVLAALERKVAEKQAKAPEPAMELRDIAGGRVPTGIKIRETPEIRPLPIPLLADVKPNRPMEDGEYRKELKACQKRLFELHNRLYQERIPMILAYEGWDAAGKGGNIKRVTSSLDPRGYEVIPVAAPSSAEKNHQHLWRFWNALPKDGHIAIFDRTWYGRCMVEHIEGFCTPEQWARSYDEINRFEKHLADWGAITLKFWLHIDQEEQLRRFKEREATPEKQYKITDEDWRNREKWGAYEQAVNELLTRTNTAWAPWIIVESNNKKYARIKTLQEIITAIEARL